jgi:NTP pyrophosphatase (non-canonical NTP hydrolase)
MADAPKQLTLAGYQKLIKKLCVQRGFDDETVAEKFMLLIEETGEFAKAARAKSTIKVDPSSRRLELDHEAADVFWMLVDLCNALGINLAAAFEAKEHHNNQRTWS